MINVNELKRNAKNIVKKYSDAQVKVREATSNDPWGPSSTIMAEIADLTYNVVAFSEIMQMIWKRLNDHGKNWRHVFKSLVLLEYLIKTGNDKVAQQCTENIFAIQTLKDFQYIEENKDHGSSIREKSKKLVALLKDPERLAAERARALKAKARLVEAVSSSGQSGASFGKSLSMNRSSNVSGDLGHGHNGSGGSSSGMLSSSSNNYQFVEADSSSGLGSDIDSARPHSLTEEETQLQIALALSKEEAERQEKTRKNDELRLKLALDASKQAAAATNSGSSIVGTNDLMDEFSGSSSSMTSGPSKQSSHHQSSSKLNKQSNIDDLLGLSFTAAESSASLDRQKQQQQQQQVTSTVPNGLFASTFASSSSVANPPRMPPQNDPWSVDPWQTTSVPTPTPSSFMNSNVISSQLTGFAPQPKATLPAVSSSVNNTLPPLQQPANSTATKLVPNQFPISSLDSIFLPAATSSTTATNNQPQPRKALSKNPFED